LSQSQLKPSIYERSAGQGDECRIRRVYLKGHELELLLLAKIRLSVLFQGVFLPEFVLSTIFKSLDLLPATVLYIDSP
jgi:hypothetical protein